MDHQPEFGFQQLFSHVVGDMAKAVSIRNGESQQQKLDRTQAAVYMVMGFLPRDAIEAMFAGHCVMFHELLVDTFRLALMGEMESLRRATRTSLVSMDKAFRENLTSLERYRMRPSDGRRDAAAATDIPLVDPVKRTAELSPKPAEPRGDRMPAAPPEMAPVQAAASVPESGLPSAEAIAACQANPDAMAALEAGDPIRFARALGIEEPNEEFLAAAYAPGSPFDHVRPFASLKANRSGDLEADAPGGTETSAAG